MMLFYRQVLISRQTCYIPFVDNDFDRLPNSAPVAGNDLYQNSQHTANGRQRQTCLAELHEASNVQHDTA